MKLFEYAIFYKPTDEDLKKGNRPKILVKPTPVIAKDEREALLLAAREIPGDYESRLSEVEIAVRPF